MTIKRMREQIKDKIDSSVDIPKEFKVDDSDVSLIIMHLRKDDSVDLTYLVKRSTLPQPRIKINYDPELKKSTSHIEI